jgi:hydroxymethylpyrimidine kinase/phosphomethylpyrimidine kinase
LAERTAPGTRVAFTIAGSDSSGGAGIQADLKIFTVMDVYGASAITAITAQNTTGVKQAIMLDPDVIEQQIDAVAGDLTIHATKTGMIGTVVGIDTVAKAVRRHNLFPLVVDPVMVAKSGDSLIDDAAVQTMIRKLLPLAAVVTPNRFEAARLLGASGEVKDLYGAKAAAREICGRFGVRACIVKGIRQPDDQEGKALDAFVYRDADNKVREGELTGDWRITTNTHGSGCAFSAAITGALAQGKPLEEAAIIAKNIVGESIRRATDLGHGNGPVNHMAWMQVKK